MMTCAICSRVLSAAYAHDPWGTTYCPRPCAPMAQCDYCGRRFGRAQLTATAAARSHNRPRCATCASAAVETPEGARRLFSDAIAWAGRHGVSFSGRERVAVRLVGTAELERMSGSRTVLGLTLKGMRFRGGRVDVSLEGIAVRAGIPPMLFRGVAIHELGHGWLATQGVSGLASWVEEGFCEVLAHGWLAELGTREARFHADQIAGNPDPVYGGGFRRMSKMAAATGFPGLIAAISRARGSAFGPPVRRSALQPSARSR